MNDFYCFGVLGIMISKVAVMSRGRIIYDGNSGIVNGSING